MLDAFADPLLVGAVVGVTMLAAIVGGVGGFGTGIILSVGLVPVIGFKAVVPTLAVAGIVINAGRLWFYRRHVDWRRVGLLLAPAVPLALAGSWFYSRLDGKSVGLLLGSVILAFVPARRWLKSRDVTLGPAGVVAGGAVFGIASGVASGTGVILIATLMGSGLVGPAVLATDAFTTIVVDLVKAIAFGRFDVLDGETAVLGLAIGLASIPGSAIAARLVERMHVRTHTAAMEALIVLGGLSILWQAVRA